MEKITHLVWNRTTEVRLSNSIWRTHTDSGQTI